MSVPEIVMLPLFRDTIGDGDNIQIDICRGELESSWISEVLDEENASTVRDESVAGTKPVRADYVTEPHRT